MAAAGKDALEILRQATELCGPSPVLAEARAQLGESMDSVVRKPANAWEHCALGRLYLRAGSIERALTEVNRAVALDPQGLWPSFYQGLCAYRLGQFADATVAFSVCIGAAPDAAGCFYNRGRSFAAMGRADQALADYDQALRCDARLSPALINRGLLLVRAGRFDQARSDFERARELGQRPVGALLILNLAQLVRANTRQDRWLIVGELLRDCCSSLAGP